MRVIGRLPIVGKSKQTLLFSPKKRFNSDVAPTTVNLSQPRSGGTVADQDDPGLLRNPNQQTCRVIPAGDSSSACANGFRGVELVSAWTSAPHTAVHINLPVKRLCLVAPPPLF